MLYPRKTLTREKFDLNGVWNINYDKNDEGSIETLQHTKNVKPVTYKDEDQLEDESNRLLFKAEAPEEIAVPASWNDQTTSWEIHNYMGTVWYSRNFYLPRHWQSKRVMLRIGAANYQADVYFNGTLLGSHTGGYMPFEFEINSAALYDQSNQLVIRVDNKLTNETVPQGHVDVDNGGVVLWRQGTFPDVHYDFYPYGGLHRPVVLYTTEKQYVTDVTVKTDIKGKEGIINWEAVLSQPGGTLKLLIDDQEQTVVKADQTVLKGTLKIKECQFWSDKNPHLYKLGFQIHNDQKLIDDYYLKVGVRTVEVKGNKFLLNGKEFYFKGFGRHEDINVIGRGLNFPYMIRDFELMRWTGANSFRTSHYPYSEEIMQMADRHGLLVIDETAANTISFGPTAATDKTLTEHRKQLRELYDRDKNYTCVVMWSITNESETWVERSGPYFKTLAEDIKKLDPSRPSTIVCAQMPADMQTEAYAYYDVVCMNLYPAWYGNCGRIFKIEELMNTALDEFYTRYKKPILMTEFGADSITGEHALPMEMWSEEYQEMMLDKMIKILRSKKYVIGEHVWNFADFKTAQHTNRPIYNRKGVFTRERQPKMAAHYLRKKWKKG